MYNTNISVWSLLADKYKVREFISRKGFKETLIPLITIWDSPSKIEFDNLPEQFVIKMNNGSGDVRVIRNKKEANYQEIKEHSTNLFYEDFGRNGEIHYSGIKPLIIVEEFLDNNKQSVKSTSLIDYKIWCFNGKAYCIMVCSNRKPGSFNISFYDRNWIFKPSIGRYNDYYRKGEHFPPPVNAIKMISMAEELSKGFPQVRIDFYEVDSKLYFGEMTFSSAAGRMDYFSTFQQKNNGGIM